MLPDIFIFNPTNEMAVGNGTNSFQANARLQKFEEDLDLLPLPFVRNTDYLLLNNIPSSEYLKQFEKAGWQIPTFKLIHELPKDQMLQNLQKGFLKPWGWSPVMHNRLKTIKKGCSDSFMQQPNAIWKPEHRELYSREMALYLLEHISKQEALYELMISENMYPRICYTEDEIMEQLRKLKNIVLKAPWSSSGRGIQMVEKGEWKSFHNQWSCGIIQRYGKVMVEPFLNKQADLAFQFHIDENKQIQFLGISWFKTNSNGQYELNYIKQIPSDLSEDAKEFYEKNKEKVTKAITEAIQSSRLVHEYCGYLGVDAMMIRDNTGKIRIHPCLEINLRYNMGTLAIKLGELIHPTSKGEFHIYFDPKITFHDFCQIQNKENPIQYKSGKFHKGFVSLTEPKDSRIFGAWMILE